MGRVFLLFLNRDKLRRLYEKTGWSEVAREETMGALKASGLDSGNSDEVMKCGGDIRQNGW